MNKITHKTALAATLAVLALAPVQPAWAAGASDPAAVTSDPSPETGETGGSEATEVLAKIILEMMTHSIEENLKVAGEESTAIGVVVRGTLGISLDDIGRFGPCGGPNSEARNIFGSLCGDI